MITESLVNELTQEMSLTRLAKTGLFRKLNDPVSDGIERETALHRAVLDKALIDLFSHHREIREDVEKWLSIENIDFIEACERASMKPEYVFEVFKTMKKVLKGDNARFKEVKAFRKRKEPDEL